MVGERLVFHAARTFLPSIPLTEKEIVGLISACRPRADASQ